MDFVIQHSPLIHVGSFSLITIGASLKVFFLKLLGTLAIPFFNRITIIAIDTEIINCFSEISISVGYSFAIITGSSVALIFSARSMASFASVFVTLPFTLFITWFIIMAIITKPSSRFSFIALFVSNSLNIFLLTLSPYRQIDVDSRPFGGLSLPIDRQARIA